MIKLLSLLAVAAVVCLASALPVATEREPREREHEVVAILKSETSKNDDGSYHTIYESADGTERKEDASVLNAGTDEQSLEVKGSYKFINDQGQEVEVFYTAGVNGFVPYGSIINPEISAVAEAAKDLPKEVVYKKPQKVDLAE